MPQDDTALHRPEGPARTGEPGVDRFAHFVIERLADGQLDCIGRGGMGLTYRALDTQLDRLVALKVISPQWVDDAEVRSRFAREARAAARLQHPNIASVLYQGVEGTTCFYAMELVVGETLESYIKRVGPIAPIHALRIAHQVALALCAAARENVLHRDLKPGNVMLTSYDDATPHAKVIDFGLAKVLSEVSTTYATGGFLGTPEFASPEQCAEAALDARSDLYSLGATLWFMLAGQPPFSGSVLAVMRAQAHEPPPFAQLGKLPAPLHALLARLLAKSPDERPATAAEAAREIEAAIALLDESEEGFHPLDIAPGTTLVHPSARLPRAPASPPPHSRSPWLAAAIGAAVIATGAALYFAGKSSVRQPVAPAPPAPPGATAAPEPTTPFINSLGMRFLPAPGVNVLISVWETRVSDFAAFVTGARHDAANRPDAEGRTWRDPGWKQGDDEPVVMVSAADALAFCEWLTRTERAAGRIGAHEFYRLPSRPEWDAAAGLPAPLGGGGPRGSMPGAPRPGERPGLPGARPGFGEELPPGESPPPGQGPSPQPPGGGAGDPGPPFLWGAHTWPPPARAGNFADRSAARATGAPTIPGYDDGFARTAPVGRFPAGALGFFDLAGNVREMVIDGDPATGPVLVLGGGWQSAAQAELRAHTATLIPSDLRQPDLGFRCVLVR